jgi:glycine betaine/proline transport system permease protein
MSDIEQNKSHKDDQSLAIKEFIGPQADYYKTQFEKIGSSSGFTPTFNWAAALLGSIWFASRGLWNWALAFTICEIIGIVQIMRGLFGDLTSDLASRAKMIEMQLQIRETQLDKAIKDNVEI